MTQRGDGQVLAASHVPSSAWSIGAERLGPTNQVPIPLAGGPTAEPTPQFLEKFGTEAAGLRAPARGMPELLAAIAARLRDTDGLDVSPDRDVVVTNGAMHAVDCTLRALTEPGARVGMICPTFFVDRLATSHGVELVLFDTRADNGWHLTEELLSNVGEADLDAMLLVNPNNPTGVVYRSDELQRLLDETAADGTLFIVDEAYEGFLYDDADRVPFSSLPGAAERTVTLRSFTKSYGLRGARLGYAFGAEPLIARVARVVEWSTLACNPFSQAFALHALSDPDAWRAPLIEPFHVNRELVRCAVEDGRLSPHTVVPEGGTFVPLDVTPLGLGSREAAVLLWRQAGVACVPGAEFPGCTDTNDTFVRLPLGAAPDDFATVIARLAVAFGEASGPHRSS